MFDGNQVMRFEKYKASDLGGLGVELKDRKGTGNYDLERTKYNIEFVSLNNQTLMSKVYSTLKSNEVQYGENKKNINLIGGVVVTSGQEFFKSLGMQFVPTEEVHQYGEHAGEPIERVNINSEYDIPEKVLEYFRYSHEFLCNLVGKENVVYSGIHFDENTPHMHFYYTPLVNSVQRKVFETDKYGNILKKEITGKDGNKKMVPIIAKDENGKAIYKTETGKFLNLDQFWKDLGGKSSYARVQDKYNEYITSKGFNLYRGNVGANVEHQTKAEHKLKETKKEIKNLQREIKHYESINNANLKTNEEILNLNQEEVLSPSKDVFKRYKDKDIEKLISYTKEVNKENLSSKNTIRKQDIEIKKLNDQVNGLKSGKELQKAYNTIKEKDIIINKHEKTIKDQKQEIHYLNNVVDFLNDKINRFVHALNAAFRAIKKLVNLPEELVKKNHIEEKESIEFFESICNTISSHKEQNKQKSHDDYEL